MGETYIKITTSEYQSLIESNIRLAMILEYVKEETYMDKKEIRRMLGMKGEDE